MTDELQDIRPPPLAYTIGDAAVAVGRNRTRLKTAIREGEINALRDGKIILITREELQRWLGTLHPTRGALDNHAADRDNDRDMEHG